jgi:hypothetical protein
MFLSTASVADFAAYLKGLTSIAQDVTTPVLLKEYIERTAWPRHPVYSAKGVWNGLLRTTSQPPALPNY